MRRCRRARPACSRTPGPTERGGVGEGARRELIAHRRARAELARRHRDGAAGARGLRAWQPGAHLAVAARAGISPLLFAGRMASTRSCRSTAPAGGWRLSRVGRRAAAGRRTASTSRSCSPTRSARRCSPRRAGIAERWGYRRDRRGRLLTRAVAPPQGAIAPRRVLSVSRHGSRCASIALRCIAARRPALRDRAQVAARGRGLARRTPWWASRPARPTARPSAGRRIAWARWRSSLARELPATPVLVGARAMRRRPSDVRSAYAAAARGTPAPAVIDLAGAHRSADARWRARRCRGGRLQRLGRDARGRGGRRAGRRDLRADQRAEDLAARAWQWHTPRHRAGDVFCRPCLLRTCPIDHRCMRASPSSACRRDQTAPGGRRRPRNGSAHVTPAVFLDRDGTLIEERGYLDRLDLIELFPWTSDALRLLRRRRLSRSSWSPTRPASRAATSTKRSCGGARHLDALLAADGVAIDAYYYCPHHPDGAVPAYRRSCRLPEAGAGHGGAGGSRPRPRCGALVRGRRRVARHRAGRATSAPRDPGPHRLRRSAEAAARRASRPTASWTTLGDAVDLILDRSRRRHALQDHD